MGLQRFKLKVAGAVVNADNASVRTMSTAGMVELFEQSLQHRGAGPAGAGGGGGSGGKRGRAKGGLDAILADLGDLWNESEYEEFAPASFMDSMAH